MNDIEVELPDGRVLVFPGGTDQGTMRIAIQRLLGTPEAGAPEPQPAPQVVPEQSPQPAVDPSVMPTISADDAQRAIDSRNARGEAAGTLLNMGGEALTLGLVGDEAAAGADVLIGRGGTYEENLARYRGNEAAMRESNPGISFAADVAPAFLPGVGLARGVAAIPSALGRMFAGIGGGAAAGASYGFMEGEGGINERIQSGAWGGLLGGALGLAAEPISRGARALYSAAGPGAAATARATRGALGLDDAGARMVAQAVERDLPYAADNLRRAGPDAVNAMTGNQTKGLLDFVVNRPGAAGASTLARIEDMASSAGQRFTSVLDDTLGKPVGVARTQRNIMRDTRQNRNEVYGAAYSRPIDYSAPQAMEMESLLQRVPEDALRKAERLMRTEGTSSQQIRATIGENGQVVYDTLPDVRQIDYITRALRDMGGFGVGEGASQGQAFSKLARDIRRTLDDLVPEYRTARGAGQDAIANREAAEFGESLLSSGTKMDAAEDTIAGMTDGEKGFVRQGMRDYLDEIMANTKAAMTDQNMDAREAVRPLKEMLSRAGQTKLRALMGPEEAARLIAEGEQAFSALNLRASVAAGSRTAPRQMAEQVLNDALPPTVGEALSEGRGLLGAAATMARPLLDDAAMLRAGRKDAVMERVGSVLMSPARQTATGGLLTQSLAPALRAGDAASELVERRLRGILGGVITTQGAVMGRNNQSAP